jgi:hypothetical protein
MVVDLVLFRRRGRSNERWSAILHGVRGALALDGPLLRELWGSGAGAGADHAHDDRAGGADLARSGCANNSCGNTRRTDAVTGSGSADRRVTSDDSRAGKLSGSRGAGS